MRRPHTTGRDTLIGFAAVAAFVALLCLFDDAKGAAGPHAVAPPASGAAR